jgi:RNA polymerase sigma-70 factor (ECF subfamily)
VTEAEFADWYARERPRVLAALTALSGDGDAAADATDEAFARAFARWDRVAKMETAGGWTYRVALNVLRRTMRRRTRTAELHATTAVDAAALATPSDEGALWTLVRTLPSRQRTAIVLRYVADQSETGIALAMGIRRSTVASTLTQARARLAALLDAAAEEEANDHA